MTDYKPVTHEPDHIPDAGKMVSDQLRGGTKKIGRPQVREVFLRNGARIEPDSDDLPDYVYESVFELLELAAPAVQGEPSRESLMVVLERDEYGKPAVWCDPEIADLVSALNGSGVRTIASCSGHGKRPGNIVLADGRELVIARSFEESRIVDSIFQGINGEPARAVVVPKTDVQGEPVECSVCHGKGYRVAPLAIMLSCPRCQGSGIYTAPQPAEQQAAPDVTALVEALEAIDRHNDSPARFDREIDAIVRAALAKPGGDQA